MTPDPHTPVEAALATVGRVQPAEQVIDAKLPLLQAAVAVFGM